MSRLVPLALSCSLLLAPTGCKQAKGVEMDTKLLIPADADVAFGFQLDVVRNSPVGPAIAGAMRGDSDISAMMDAAPKCNLSLEGMHGFFAGKLESDDEFLAVVEAPGIGDEDIVKCVEDETRKATGSKDGILLFSTRGDVRTTPQEGGGYLIILNKNTIVVVGRPWEDAVFAAIEQPTASKADTTLTKAIAGVDPSADLWVSAVIAEADVADLGIPGSAAIRWVAVSLSLASGLGIDTNLGFTADEEAALFRTAMPDLIAEIGPSVGEAGLPEDLLSSLKIGGEGSTVNAKLEISSETVPAIVTMMSAIMSEP